jgi:hypothetical protein
LTSSLDFAKNTGLQTA